MYALTSRRIEINLSREISKIIVSYKNFPQQNGILTITMIRDESDILDLWLEETSKWSDLMIIIDHLSSISTSEFLRNWSSRNNAIYARRESPKFLQAKYINSITEAAVQKLPKTAIIFPLDADEFLSALSIKNIKTEFNNGQNKPIKIFWRNSFPEYFRQNQNKINSSNKIYISKEKSKTHKVLATVQIIKNKKLRFTDGSHYLTDKLGAYAVTSPLPTVEILHLPLRNLEQYNKKIQNGIMANNAKKRFTIFQRKLSLHLYEMQAIPINLRETLFPLIVYTYGSVGELKTQDLFSEKKMNEDLSDLFTSSTLSNYLCAEQ